jgi:predicted translin family RNA/ssDNA-binding protein
MGRGNGRVKTIKTKTGLGGDAKDLSAVFGQIFGESGSMDFDIALDKLNKLKSNISRVKKLLESFSKTIYNKVLVNGDGEESAEVRNYKKNLEGFVEDCKHISDWSEFGKNPNEVISFYRACKEHKVSKDCISMCRKLIKFKKNLEDIENLSDDFIKSPKLKDLQLFTFCNFDIKYMYVYGNIDDSAKKYILIFLSMILKSTKEIFDVITSPDVDIDKISKIVVDVIASTKKMLPRCSKAFSKLESSMDLLKDNFAEYYKDFVSTKDQTTIITNFIADCTKEENEKADASSGKMDVELTRQFMDITNFFRKQSAGRIKDPAVNQLLSFLDKQFKSLDVEESDNEEDDVDKGKDIEVESKSTEN